MYWYIWIHKANHTVLCLQYISPYKRIHNEFSFSLVIIKTNKNTWYSQHNCSNENTSLKQDKQMYYGKKVRQMYWYPILTCKCIQICFLNASMTTLQKNLWCILNQSIFISRPLMYFVTDTYCHANWILLTQYLK